MQSFFTHGKLPTRAGVVATNHARTYTRSLVENSRDPSLINKVLECLNRELATGAFVIPTMELQCYVPECSTVCTNYYSLRAHIHDHPELGELVITCNSCNGAFKSTQEYRHHRARVHADGYRCGACKIPFKKSQRLPATPKEGAPNTVQVQNLQTHF
ncbi:hypothetical protein M3Y98_00695900 [Aphelenchoides besseyi]|nr:hypothetical protein M3Y98_00695900 [Aphelenchoides besseyi]